MGDNKYRYSDDAAFYYFSISVFIAIYSFVLHVVSKSTYLNCEGIKSSSSPQTAEMSSAQIKNSDKVKTTHGHKQIMPSYLFTVSENYSRIKVKLDQI